MIKYKKYVLLFGGLCMLSSAAAGCGLKNESQENAQRTTQETTLETAGVTTAAEKTDGKVTSIICSEDSVLIEGDGASEESGIITITKAGTYRLEGKLTEGRIVVDASKEDAVILELNGFEITSSSLSAVYGIKSGEMRLKLMDGTVNKVTDGTEYVLEEGADEPDAAIFTKSDLVIEGSGSLEVIGNYSDGIRSKDNLNILSGTITVTAKEDGITGKDSLIVDGGLITVYAGDDGIKSKGAVIINDGTILVAESYEGIEALTIDINGGSIDITSADDGLNAAEDTDSETENTGRGNASFAVSENAYVRIAGGIVTVNSSADGIDSNGHFYVDGGELYISGPTSGGDGALDYNGNGIITGGVVIAAGSSGMTQTFTNDSEQNSIVVYFENTQTAGTEIAVADEGENVIASYTPETEYSCAVISAPELVTDKTYKITAGEETQEVTLTGILTTAGTKAAGEMGGHGGQGARGGQGMPGMGGGRPDRNQEEMPEGVKGNPGQRSEGREIETQGTGDQGV